MLVFYQPYIKQKIKIYEAEMSRNIFCRAHVCTALFFGIGGFLLNQAYETIDFFSANSKRNIESDFGTTDADIENKKCNCDAPN